MYSKNYLDKLEENNDVLITSQQLHMLCLFYSDVIFVLHTVLDDNILSSEQTKGINKAISYYQDLHDHYYHSWRSIIEYGNNVSVVSEFIDYGEVFKK